MGAGLVCGRIGREAWTVFSVICQMVPWRGARGNFPWADQCAKNVIKNVIFIDVDAIVHMPNPLAHPIEQAGGLQGGVPGLMANSYLHKTTVNESVSLVVRGLQPFHLKDVSTVSGCINRVSRSTSR